MAFSFRTAYFLCELGLEEVYIFGHVQRVFPAFADHVGMEDVVSLLKDSDHVRLFLPIPQRALKEVDQQIYHLQKRPFCIVQDTECDYLVI